MALYMPYAIPHSARQVVKFNPVNESMTRIGPVFGNHTLTWYGGAMTVRGIIYCPPFTSGHGILKIDTNTDTVTELDKNLLPERGLHMWLLFAAALDGCIYFMPSYARRIMKLDPKNNDAISRSVRDD